jgi:hypothetical protein
LHIEWINGDDTIDNKWSTETSKSRVCEPEDITQKHYDNGKLYICSAESDKMTLYGNYEQAPYKSFGVKHRPNYDSIKTKPMKLSDKQAINKEVDNFEVAREQINQIADFNLHDGSNPISKAKPKWHGRHQLEVGYHQQADSYLQVNSFIDFNSWVSFNPTNTYTFYR